MTNPHVFFTKWYVLTHGVSEAKIRMLMFPRNHYIKRLFSLQLLQVESQDPQSGPTGQDSCWEGPGRYS